MCWPKNAKIIFCVKKEGQNMFFFFWETKEKNKNSNYYNPAMSKYYFVALFFHFYIALFPPLLNWEGERIRMNECNIIYKPFDRRISFASSHFLRHSFDTKRFFFLQPQSCPIGWMRHWVPVEGPSSTQIESKHDLVYR